MFNPSAAVAKWIAIVAGGLLLVGVVWFLMTEPGRQRAKANEAEAGAVVSSGHAAAAKDASKVITTSAARDTAIDARTQENRDAILNSPGAAAPVDPGIDDVARRRLCMRDSARRGPACQRLLGTRP